MLDDRIIIVILVVYSILAKMLIQPQIKNVINQKRSNNLLSFSVFLEHNTQKIARKLYF